MGLGPDRNRLLIVTLTAALIKIRNPYGTRSTNPYGKMGRPLITVFLKRPYRAFVKALMSTLIEPDGTLSLLSRGSLP